MRILKGITEEKVKSVTQMLHFISNNNTISIIKLLEENKTLTAKQMFPKLSLQHSDISHYLQRMLNHGLVITNKPGKKYIYTLNTAKLEKVLAAVDALLDKK